MPKANIMLPDGTKIEIDGSLEGVQKLTEHFGNRRHVNGAASAQDFAAPGPAPAPASAQGAEDDVPNIPRIVATIKDCEEAELIEMKVLDQKDVMNRVLLCLWAVHKYFSGNSGLTSGEIDKITAELGVRVNIANVSTALSGKAKAFLAGDAVRKKGAAVRYKLNRRGVQTFEGLLKS